MTFPAWSLGAQVEYANGFKTTVIHVDGEFAILRSHPDSRLDAPFDDGDGFIVARGDQREFSFVDEVHPICVRLDAAMRQLADAKEGEALAGEILKAPKKKRGA
jgi:hypothetical protein